MEKKQCNSFGIYDRPMRFSRKMEDEITLEEFKAQIDEGAFLMDRNEAVMLGFIHPDHESDSVLTGIGGNA